MEDVNEKKTKGKISVISGSLGYLCKGKYLIEPDCIEGLKNLIRLLKRDDKTHINRRCMGDINIVHHHLIHIIKSDSDLPDLFNITLRLLINLTTPTNLLFGEEISQDKTEQHIYLTLLSQEQTHKFSFDDVEFWNKICSKLTLLFEIDWADRSTDDGIEIERILILLRNVLQMPENEEGEKKADNDDTIHDKILWALRQSQILELLLLVISNQNEEPYYLNLLEILYFLLREHNPKLLGQCDVEKPEIEKDQDVEDLKRCREIEKSKQKSYANTRNFRSTFVFKGMKSISNKGIICHKTLNNATSFDSSKSKCIVKPRRPKISLHSLEEKERRSTFLVRLFLKEFCSELLTYFSQFITTIKNRLDSGKSLPHDKTYYFWAISFFLRFAVATNVDVNLIKNCLSIDSFHYIQTNMDIAYEHFKVEKAKNTNWIRRIHIILKAYQALLETLFWIDHSRNPMIRAISREIKSDLFYFMEYREMTLQLILKYEPKKFPLSYLKNLIQTTHLFIKLLEEFSKQTKLVVQKVAKKKQKRKKLINEKLEQKETALTYVDINQKIWDKINDDLFNILMCESSFPDISPFDAALDIPIDDQKERAMKNIQKQLFDGNIREAVGLLRSSRKVWPENNYFGSQNMTSEDEFQALQKICMANLGSFNENTTENNVELDAEKELYELSSEEDLNTTKIIEQDFNIMDFKKRLVHKKVVECCGILLKNYNKNSDHVNHCALKLLHRIGWECCMPAMLYQASLFHSLLIIMNDNVKNYEEINTFTKNLFRSFKKHVSTNPVVFLELLFWKDYNIALEIQHGYQAYSEINTSKKRKSSKKNLNNKNENEECEDSNFEKKKGKEKTCRIKEFEETGKTVSKKGKSSKKKTVVHKVQSDISSDHMAEKELGDSENNFSPEISREFSRSETPSESFLESSEQSNINPVLMEKMSVSLLNKKNKEEFKIINIESSDANETKILESNENEGLEYDNEQILGNESEKKSDRNKFLNPLEEKNDEKEIETSSLHSDEELLHQPWACSHVSGSKKRRCISSDSEDFEDITKEDENLFVGHKKRKPVIIDSDSD